MFHKKKRAKFFYSILSTVSKSGSSKSLKPNELKADLMFSVKYCIVCHYQLTIEKEQC